MMQVFAAGCAKEENPELIAMMKTVGNGLEKYEAGDLLLTDDKAPVELLSMKAIDAIIREEVEYYKVIYREKGLSGLLEAL